MAIKQIFHPYEKWEDYKNGMWRKVIPSEEADFLTKAIAFTGDHILYGSWMMKVIVAWPIACEHNLSDCSINREAWVGHAAVSLAIDCPEYITRQAWWKLTEKQQNDANDQADRAIRQWEINHIKRNAPQLILF